MQHNIRSGLSCLHEQDISYIVLYGGYAAPNRLEETVRWHGSVVLHIMKRGYIMLEQNNKKKPKKYAGILAHPTSFPSPYGIGDLGPGA